MASGGKKSHKAIQHRVADFETTTDIDDCRVWAWASIAVDNLDDYVYGNSIDGFMEYLDNKPSITYFHNLAFDASFIIDWLLKNGYEYTEDKPGDSQFTTLISDTGKFYSVTVISHNSVRTEFRDSFKKLPLSVAKVAEAFKLTDHKLSIDYHTHRKKGHELTEEEQAYLRNDVAIVAQALKIVLDTGMKKLTVGADALSEYKTLLGKRDFTDMFPTLNSEIDAEIRKAYRGGFTYADPRFSGSMQGAGKVYDVNSLYPYVMYDREIPYGEPTFVDGAPLDDGREFITSITFKAKLKRNHIPCIQVKRSPHFSPTQYLDNIDEYVTLSCTSVDLRLWELHYDLDIISFNGSYMFNTQKGLFNKYIDKWMDVKERSEGGMRQIAKLHLNSLYGKFATNTNVTCKYPILKDETVKLVTGPHKERNPVYTPAGVFITSYAREVTLTAALANYPRFAYADTDSIHLIGTQEPAGIMVHGSQMGAWKHEYDFTNAVYVRAKQYAETKDNGKHEVHIAGAPESITSKLSPKDLLHDAVWDGKLLPIRTPGGIVLEDTTFTFKAK